MKKNNGYFSIQRDTLEKLAELPIGTQGIYLRLYAKASYNGKQKGTFHTTFGDLATFIGLARKNLKIHLDRLEKKELLQIKRGVNQNLISQFTIVHYFRVGSNENVTANVDNLDSVVTKPLPPTLPAALPAESVTPSLPTPAETPKEVKEREIK